MDAYTTFQYAFEGDLVTPTDPGYDEAIARWSLNAVRKAKIVAFVKTSKDVSLAILYSKAAKLPLAIRGGGHSASGSSSSEGGVVIDLSRYFADVTIDKAGEKHPDLKRVDANSLVATAGGGATWVEVDAKAIKAGMATVGGTVNHTGIGGLTLGGGYGHLTGRHGLTIDNLLKVEIVTADGSVLIASEETNPDLFWGIRGGGSNFGVVTTFVYKLHPQIPTVYGGVLIFAPTSLQQLTEAATEWRKEVEGIDDVNLMTAIAKGPAGPMVMAIVFYNGPEAEGRIKFKRIFDVGPVMDQTGEMPYDKVNEMLNGHAGHGSCNYQKGTPYTSRTVESQTAIFEKISDFLAKHPNMQAIAMSEFYPLTKVMSMPDDAMAFPRNPHSYLVVLVTWADNTPENLQVAKEVTHNITEIASKGNTGVSASHALAYANYHVDSPPADALFNRTKLLYGDKYPRLQALKQKYDPEIIFSKFFPIEPSKN